jgi:hypothetical protein
MANVVIDIAAQFTGKQAFRQAETSAQKMEKSVGRLGKQLASVFAASKIYSFGKASVKAFAEDEKAARSLALALANTGNAFAQIEVEKFIGDLQRTTGVLDDNLRPAFRTLLTATGDVTKSQKALALALDISAGTGKDLSTVSAALARGYAGQTTGLSRLGAGLTKATLATGDMDLITGELAVKFQGQAIEATKGFAGQMALLTVSVENAKEAIGEGLVGALSILAGTSSSTGGSIEVIDRMAKGIAEGAKNIAFMIKQFEALKPVIIAIGALLLIYFAPITAAVLALGFILAKGGANLRKSKFTQGPAQQSPGERLAIDAAAKAKKKADADALKLTKTKNILSKVDNDATTRKIVLTGDQLALAELEKKFDVERIGLFAALNQATDSETQMRLKSLIAIYDQNGALASQIIKTNEAADAMDNFGKAMYGAIGVLLNFGQFAIGERDTLRQMGIGVTPTSQGFAALAPSMPNGYEGFGSGLSDIGSGNYGGLAGAGRYGGGGSTVVVNVAGSVSTERDLVDAITQGIYNNQAAGIPINYSTVY